MDYDNDDDVGQSLTIKAFLINKLKAITEANKQLATSISQIEESKGYSLDKTSENCFKVGKTYTTFAYDKWCFIVELYPTENNFAIYKGFNFICKWYPLIAPRHTLITYSNDMERNFVNSTQISQTTLATYVAIIFEEIPFAKHTKYECEGLLCYQPAKNSCNRVFRLPVPTFVITLDPLCVGTQHIVPSALTSNRPEALIASIACSFSLNVAIHLRPCSFSSTLGNFLIIDCMFQEIYDGKSSKYFALISSESYLNGIIIKVLKEQANSEIYDATLFASDKQHMVAALHYLQSKINGLTIWPHEQRQDLQCLIQQDEDVEMSSSQIHAISDLPLDNHEIKQMNECMLKQVNEVIYFFENSVNNPKMNENCNITDEYYAFRNTITVNEYKTDLLHEKLLN